MDENTPRGSSETNKPIGHMRKWEFGGWHPWVLTMDTFLNPDSFLLKTKENQETSNHNCLNVKYQTGFRPDTRALHDKMGLLRMAHPY